MENNHQQPSPPADPSRIRCKYPESFSFPQRDNSNPPWVTLHKGKNLIYDCETKDYYLEDDCCIRDKYKQGYSLNWVKISKGHALGIRLCDEVISWAPGLRDSVVPLRLRD